MPEGKDRTGLMLFALAVGLAVLVLAGNGCGKEVSNRHGLSERTLALQNAPPPPTERPHANICTSEATTKKATRRCRVIEIGMTQSEVANLLGHPDQVNSTITAGGTSEQWVYWGGYIYIKGGVVTSMQAHD